jgi:hypothetical protein
MAVVDVCVRDDVDELARLEAGYLRHHHGENGILHHVPVVGGQHVLGALVQYGVELVPGHVEGHGIGAGVQRHLRKIGKVVDVGHYAPGGGIVLQIPDDLVHLIHVPLGVVVLNAQLIAVSLSDGAGFVRPGVPHPGAQVVDVVGLRLPYPQKLVYGGLPVGAAEGQYGKLLRKIVAVYNSEFLYCVGGRAVLPAGTHLPVGVPDAVFKDVSAVCDEQLIRAAHTPHAFRYCFCILPQNTVPPQQGISTRAAKAFG